MSNKPTMRRAGRKLRRTLDNYIQALEEAKTSGVSMLPERVITRTLDDGSTAEFNQPDPSLSILGDHEYLKSVRFQLTYVERMTEEEAATDPTTEPATPSTGATG